MSQSHTIDADARSSNAILGVILAGGQGKRMQSSLPKVLHPLEGRPLIDYVADSLHKAKIQDRCLVVSPMTYVPIAEHFKGSSMWFCEQPEARGTGDAVASVAPLFHHLRNPSFAHGKLLQGPEKIPQWTHVLICYGDVPMMREKTLRDFSAFGTKHDLAVIACEFSDPKGYGRILRDEKGGFLRIVEDRDASDVERKIKLCNTGLIFARADILFECLSLLSPNNAQNEYYLTDVLRLAREKGHSVGVFIAENEYEFAGVNNLEQLQELETALKKGMV